ncbi:MAG: DinB family protein [bacterium]|nr:DinB family protein [bacterium]
MERFGGYRLDPADLDGAGVMGVQPLLNHYAWNLAYADALTRDVDVALWARSGGQGLENHPAWTLGHLVTGSALVAADLGASPALPDGWRDLFERRGPNDSRRPDEDASHYPPREVVWAELVRQHELVTNALRGAEPESLTTREAWRFDGYLPTSMDALLFMLVGHENVHLGQLGCWRRRFGLPSAMASMDRGA